MAWPNAWPPNSALRPDKLGLAADRAGRGDGPGHGPMQGGSDPLRRGGRSPLACHGRDQRRARFEHDPGSGHGHRRARGPTGLVHDARHRVRRRVRHERDRAAPRSDRDVRPSARYVRGPIRGQRAGGTMAPTPAPRLAPPLAPRRRPSTRCLAGGCVYGCQRTAGVKAGVAGTVGATPRFSDRLDPARSGVPRSTPGVAPPCRRRDRPRACMTEQRRMPCLVPRGGHHRGRFSGCARARSRLGAWRRPLTRLRP